MSEPPEIKLDKYDCGPGRPLKIYSHGSLFAKEIPFYNLPPKERAVYASKKMGLTWREMGEAFNVPIETLRSRYHRACRKVS